MHTHTFPSTVHFGVSSVSCFKRWCSSVQCACNTFFFCLKKIWRPPQLTAAWDSTRLPCRTFIYPNQNLDVNKRDSFLQKIKQNNPKTKRKIDITHKNWPFKCPPLILWSIVKIFAAGITPMSRLLFALESVSTWSLQGDGEEAENRGGDRADGGRAAPGGRGEETPAVRVQLLRSAPPLHHRHPERPGLLHLLRYSL